MTSSWKGGTSTPRKVTSPRQLGWEMLHLIRPVDLRMFRSWNSRREWLQIKVITNNSNMWVSLLNQLLCNLNRKLSKLKRKATKVESTRGMTPRLLVNPIPFRFLELSIVQIEILIDQSMNKNTQAKRITDMKANLKYIQLKLRNVNKVLWFSTRRVLKLSKAQKWRIALFRLTYSWICAKPNFQNKLKMETA